MNDLLHNMLIQSISVSYVAKTTFHILIAV